MGVKKAAAAAFIIILLIITAYHTGWLDVILEAFTGMRLKELLGERMPEFDVTSVRLVKVRDSPKSYAFSMNIDEREVWCVEEQTYKQIRRPRYENWTFEVFPFKSRGHSIGFDKLNWTVAKVNGREMLIVSVPANHTLMFRRNSASNLTASRDLWFRADILFLEGPISPIYIGPQAIVSERTEWSATLLHLYYVAATSWIIYAGDPFFMKNVKRHLLISASLWEHRRCTVTATIEDFAVTADLNFTKYVGCGLSNEMYIVIPPKFADPCTSDIWPERNYTVALSADIFEPETVLEIEVENGRHLEIISFTVKVGSDIISVKPRNPIKKGERYIFRVAPEGDFIVGGAYNVTVTALYEDFKAIKITKQVTCVSS